MARNVSNGEGTSSSALEDEVLNFSDVEDDASGFSFLQCKPKRNITKRGRTQEFPKYPRVDIDMNEVTKRAKSQAADGSGQGFGEVVNCLAAKELKAASLEYRGEYESIFDTVAFWWEQFQPILVENLRQVSMVDNTRNLKNETLCQQKQELHEHLSSLRSQEKTWKSLEQGAAELNKSVKANRIEQLLKATPQSLCLRLVELKQKLHSIVEKAKRSEVARNALLKEVDANVFKGYEKHDAKLLIRSLSAN